MHAPMCHAGRTAWKRYAAGHRGFSWIFLKNRLSHVDLSRSIHRVNRVSHQNRKFQFLVRGCVLSAYELIFGLNFQQTSQRFLLDLFFKSASII